MKGPTLIDDDFYTISEGNKGVSERIKRILMTIPGERVNNAEFGSRLKQFLFESDYNVLSNLKKALKNDIERWEPTVEVTEVIIDIEDEHIAKVSLSLLSTESSEPFDYELALSY